MPLQPPDSDLMHEDYDHHHGEKPGQQVIAGDVTPIKECHRVLRQRRRADQSQPGIELAGARDDIDQDGDAGGVERNGPVGLRWAA